MIRARRALLKQLGFMMMAPRSRSMTLGAAILSKSDPPASARSAGRAVFSVTDYGAKGDGMTDCTAAIRMTLERAAQVGGTVLVPRGRYLYGDTLPLRHDVTVVGVPGSSLVAKSERQALRIVGDNVTLRGLGLRSDAVDRKEASHAHAIAATDAANLLIEDCSITGANAAGIYLERCRNFVVRNNTVVRTLADTIHMTGGSANGIVSGNTCLHGGDDGVAVVSYVSQRAICRNISIVGNIISGGNARGIAVSGGTNVRIWRNRVSDTKWAGVYLASEDSYNTYGTSDISVEDNELTAVNRNRDGGSHACITIVGRPGKSIVRSTQAPNQNRGIYLASNTVKGDGRGGIRVDQFARGILAIGNIITDTDGWGVQTAAVEATFAANRIERAGRGGILVGRECLGGSTRIVDNEIYLANGRNQPAVIIEPSELVEAILQRNEIRYDTVAGLEAIRITDALAIDRSSNTVNGRLVD